MHLDKNQSRIFAKAIMQELYKIQRRWDVWEKAIADLCNKSRDDSGRSDGNTR